jgi:hypothetical protein
VALFGQIDHAWVGLCTCGSERIGSWAGGDFFRLALVINEIWDHMSNRVCGFAGAGLAPPYLPPLDPVGITFFYR